MIKESRKEMKENGLVYCLEVLLDLLDCNHTGICVCVYTHKRVTWRGVMLVSRRCVVLFLPDCLPLHQKWKGEVKLGLSLRRRGHLDWRRQLIMSLMKIIIIILLLWDSLTLLAGVIYHMYTLVVFITMCVSELKMASTRWDDVVQCTALFDLINLSGSLVKDSIT